MVCKYYIKLIKMKRGNYLTISFLVAVASASLIFIIYTPGDSAEIFNSLEFKIV